MMALTRIVMRRRAARPRDDSGSLMLAMIAAIVVAGVVFATMSMVMAGESKTRSDQRYTAAIQGADAGVQDAFVQISKLDPTSSATSLQNATGVTVGNQTYTWTATRASASAISWTVTSTSTGTLGSGSTTRTVTATIAQNELFPMAAFADSTINFNGANSAVSYPVAGYGIIGTNTTVNLKGNATADGLSLFDTTTAGTTNRCSGNCGLPTTYTAQKLDVKSAVSTTGFITQQLNACKAASGGTLQAFVGSTIAASATPYCFSSFFANTTNFTVTGDPTLSAKVFVDGGDVTLGNKNHCAVNNDVAGAPNSVRLEIFSTGSTVTTYNQCADGAAVYAPNAACTGQTSNAQTDFYGSLICNTIDNVGGWTFHYDTRLATLGDGTWHLKAYAEP